MKSTVLTDASFKNVKKKPNSAGWAVWVRIDNDPAPYRYYGTFKETPHSSAYAELYAAINGIYFSCKHGGTDILLQSDCMAVVHALNNHRRYTTMWDAKEAALKKLLIAKPPLIKAKHVKAHGAIVNARTYVNDWCDRKAKEARIENEKGNTLLCREY